MRDRAGGLGAQGDVRRAGDDDDRHLEPAEADLAEDVPPIQARHLHSEQHQQGRNRSTVANPSSPSSAMISVRPSTSSAVRIMSRTSGSSWIASIGIPHRPTTTSHSNGAPGRIYER